jgi:hypothetical protein
MSNNFEFKDTLSYEAPASPDCLMVPELQWDELYNNLQKTHPIRDNLLWSLFGVCGGGFISCLATYIALPANTSDLLKITFLLLSIGCPLASIVLLILAIKTGSETTATAVCEQMSVLKKGFRKLTSKQ